MANGSVFHCCLDFCWANKLPDAKKSASTQKIASENSRPKCLVAITPKIPFLFSVDLIPTSQMRVTDASLRRGNLRGKTPGDRVVGQFEFLARDTIGQNSN